MMYRPFSTYTTLYLQTHILESLSLVIVCNNLDFLTIFFSFKRPWNFTALCFCLCYPRVWNIRLVKYTSVYIPVKFTFDFILFPALLSLPLNLASLKRWEVLRVATNLIFNFQFPNPCLEINIPSRNVCWIECIRTNLNYIYRGTF